MRHKQIPWKRKWTKQHWILLKKRRLTTIIKAEMKLALRKKTFAIKKSYFQWIIILHSLKLALNKSMRASDDEQSVNKLWPEQLWTTASVCCWIHLNSSFRKYYDWLYSNMYRSSCSQMFCELGVLKNFSKSTERTPKLESHF